MEETCIRLKIYASEVGLVFWNLSNRKNMAVLFCNSNSYMQEAIFNINLFMKNALMAFQYMNMYIYEIGNTGTNFEPVATCTRSSRHKKTQLYLYLLIPFSNVLFRDIYLLQCLSLYNVPETVSNKVCFAEVIAAHLVSALRILSPKLNFTSFDLVR